MLQSCIMYLSVDQAGYFFHFVSCSVNKNLFAKAGVLVMTPWQLQCQSWALGKDEDLLALNQETSESHRNHEILGLQNEKKSSTKRIIITGGFCKWFCK